MGRSGQIGGRGWWKIRGLAACCDLAGGARKWPPAFLLCLSRRSALTQYLIRTPPSALYGVARNPSASGNRDSGYSADGVFYPAWRPPFWLLKPNTARVFLPPPLASRRI
jgi:hypothetical protein